MTYPEPKTRLSRAIDLLYGFLAIAALAASLCFAGCCSEARCQEPSSIVVPIEKIKEEGNELKPYLCVFSAKWCGPCKRMKPAIEAMKREGYLIYILDVDAEEDHKAAEKMGVTQLPTIVMMAGGKERGRLVGAQTEGTLKQLYDSFREPDNKPDDGKKPDDNDAGIDLPKKLDYRLF